MTLKVQGIEVFRADRSLGRSVAVLHGVGEVPALRPKSYKKAGTEQATLDTFLTKT